MICSCRNCQKHYDEFKSRADWKGYCSARCQHEKARSLGWRKPSRLRMYQDTSEFHTLKEAGEIGNVQANPRSRT